MRANSLSRWSQSTLALLVGLSFAFPAHAEGQNEPNRSRRQAPIVMQDGFHLQMDIVEIPSTMLSTTTDLPPNSDQIIQAVHAAVKVGTGRVKYSFESPLVVGRNLIMNVGLKEPFTRSRRVSKGGKVNTQTEYEDVGCRINIETHHIGEAPDDGLFMQAYVEWSDLRRKSGVVIADDLEAPIFIEQSCQFATTLKPGATFAFRMGAKRSEKADAWTTVVVATLSENKPAS